MQGVALCFTMAASASGASPVNVKTVSYKDTAYYPEHNTAAEVIAKYDSNISAELTATVVSVNHDTGDRVSQGDTVISLDCRTYRLQLQQAKAAHDALNAQYENAKKLFASAQKLQKQNNISQELYNQRNADASRLKAELYNQRNADASRLKAELINTKAGIEAAEIAVEKCSINAPYDGYISERFISKGELAQPGTPMFQIITSEPGHVEAYINNVEYQSFLQGNSYQFVFNDVGYDLAVDSILPVMDRNYRTHTAILSFVDDSAPTGSHGELKWSDNKLALPSSLVVVRNQQAGVFIANSTHAKFIPVESYIEGHPAFIELEAETQIISTGRHGLKDGDSITAIPSN
jgi:RND family efflux transporter MFP subunit